MIFVIGGFLVLPLATEAFSGTNASNIRVKIHTEQGNDWFRSGTARTDYTGVLEAKNMLPGWYEIRVDDADQKSSQTIAIRARMLDLDGRRLKEKTNIDLFYETSGGVKTAISTVQTDKDGWVRVSGLSADTKYKFEMTENDNSSVSQKDNKTRIKCKSQVDDSDWFPAYYGRTDEDQVFEVANVLPGKYKFKYKEGDRDIALPFTLNARMLNEKGERLKEATKVHLWAYLGPEKTRVFAGEVMTNVRGEITVPGLMHGVKYKVKVIE